MKNLTTLTAASVLVFAASFQARAEGVDTPVAAPERATLVARVDLTRPADGVSSARTAVGDPGKRGAMLAAAKGPTELRRYIQRTRMIYGLEYNQFIAN
jgi:hypothetical protein